MTLAGETIELKNNTDGKREWGDNIINLKENVI